MLKLTYVAAAAMLVVAAPTAAQSSDFLAFPMVNEVAAAEGAAAFAWTMRHGADTSVYVARAPDFAPVRLFTQSDTDGAPISGAALSPDGRTLVFRTGEAFGASEAGYNPAGLIAPPVPTLWLVEARAGAKPVRIGPGVSPSFAPDGKRLVYRHKDDLWAVDLPAAAPKPVVLVAGGARFGAAVWSKDGRSLIFAQDRGGWGFLGQYRLGEDRVRWLVTGADRVSDPVVSPDGRTVAYLRWPGREHGVAYDQTESEPFAVETVDIASGTVRQLWQSQGRAGTRGSDDPEGHLRWADDRTIVFRSEQDGWARLHAVARDGGAPRALTPANCEVAESELAAPDTLFVIHNCRDIDTRQLSLVTASTGSERAVPADDVVLAQAAAAGDGRHVAFVGSGTDAAPLMRVLDIRSGRRVLAQTPADFGFARRYTAPPPKPVRLKAADGATVPAQLFLPGTPGPHPALVYVHGGPQRQMFPAFHFSGYYANDYAINRRLAELGYVVLSVNYRSGVGYGRAFREAPGRGWRDASEYADVLGAGRWLAARDDVDPKRIGIWGGSYGGLLTGQALARNSELFAAGVAIHGVFDWSWPSPVPGHLNPSGFFGVGEKDRGAARAASPVGAIDRWRSPVLLLSGDQDMNVDVRETVDLTQKLRARGVAVRTVLFPGEAHDMVRHESWRRVWEEMHGFLAETLRN